MTSHLPPEAKVNFFASHSWTHSRRRDGLHAVLQPWMRGIDFEDFSISRGHPLNTDADPELARELRNIIVHMDALLIMAGMYANNSPWMQFEINMAFAFNVPIIPILVLGQQRVPRLPTRLATCQPVRWRGDSTRSLVELHFARATADYRIPSCLSRRCRQRSRATETRCRSNAQRSGVIRVASFHDAEIAATTLDSPERIRQPRTDVDVELPSRPPPASLAVALLQRLQLQSGW